MVDIIEVSNARSFEEVLALKKPRFSSIMISIGINPAKASADSCESELNPRIALRAKSLEIDLKGWRRFWRGFSGHHEPAEDRLNES